MPIINVTLIEGRAPEKLRDFITALTDAAVQSLDAPKESVRVILNEVPATNFAAGDVTVAERSAAKSKLA